MDNLLAFALPQEWKIGFVFGLLVVAIVLFAIEKLSVDVITFILLLALIGTRVLSPGDAFAGFSEDIIIMLGSIFVIGGALQVTGVLDALVRKLIHVGGRSENWLIFLIFLLCSGLSAFMNNTTVVAMFIGPVISLARQRKLAPSRILLPMAYASILGGTCTLIGTSTNMAVSGFIGRERMKPLGLFEITPIGLIIVAVGITYLMLLGRRLLPHREESPPDFVVQDYLSEIIILHDSRLIGQSMSLSDLSKMGFRILKLWRGGRVFIPAAEEIIKEADVLLVAGKVENLIKIRTNEGLEIKTRFDMDEEYPKSAQARIAEVVVMPRSDLVGRTLHAIQQDERGLVVLAVNRCGQELRENVGTAELQVGDLLLIQAHEDHLDALKRERKVAVLEEMSSPTWKKRKGFYVVGFFIAALAASGFGLLPASACFLAAAVLTIVSRCITIEQAYEFIDWRLLILIGGMTAFGVAIEQTGGAAVLAKIIIGLLGQWGAMPVLTGFFVLTIILTQPMSNAAAALVVLPVALETAREMGVNERTFAIGVMLAASVSFIAPFEPSCILVYGPGRYKFMDFVKTGGLLTVILTVVSLLLIPHFWPLHPGASEKARIRSIQVKPGVKSDAILEPVLNFYEKVFRASA